MTPFRPELPPHTVLDFDGEQVVMPPPLILNGDFEEWEEES